MKSIKIFLLILVFIFIGCSANLIKHEINYKQPLYKTPDESKIAVITRFSYEAYVNSYEDDTNVESLKKSVAAVIYSTGMYKKVVFGFEKAEGSEAVIDRFDIVVIPKNISSYDWVVAWPAVYPCPISWPFQPYRGKVQVDIKIKYSNNINEIDHLISNKSHHSTTFYGFFRKKTI